MKIILLKDIKGFGKKLDIKTASDGYAKNFLIPQGLAKPAESGSVRAVAEQKEASDKLKSEALETSKQLAKQIENREFNFYPKTGKSGEVFGSITKDDIEKEITKMIPEELAQKIKIEAALPKPLKTLGVHEVEINFKNNIKAKIKVVLNNSPTQK